MTAEKNANGEKTEFHGAVARLICNFIMEMPKTRAEESARGEGWVRWDQGALTNYDAAGSRWTEPGNLGRATRLSCASKTMIPSRQGYALSARIGGSGGEGRLDDEKHRFDLLISIRSHGSFGVFASWAQLWATIRSRSPLARPILVPRRFFWGKRGPTRARIILLVYVSRLI